MALTSILSVLTMPRITKPPKTPNTRQPTERKFTFLDLPPETRNLIYKYTLSSFTPLEIHPAPSTNTTKPGKPPPKVPSTKPPPLRSTPSVPGVALLRTCKEIHAKATKHLYANPLAISAQHLCQFTTAIGPRGRAPISRLTITHTHTPPTTPAVRRCVDCDDWLVATNGIHRIVVRDPGNRAAYGYLMAVETFGVFRCWIEGQAVEKGRKDAALERVFWKGFACSEWVGLGEAFAEALGDLTRQCVGEMVEMVYVVVEVE